MQSGLPGVMALVVLVLVALTVEQAFLDNLELLNFAIKGSIE